MDQGRKIHKLMASPQTVHTDFFDATLPPVLAIESGDTVVMSSLMLMDGQLRCGMTLEELIATRQAYTDRHIGSHTLTGPIFVKGADPGEWKQTEFYDESLDLVRFLDIEKGWGPERDCEIVNLWARRLHLNEWFNWHPFEDVPLSYYNV